MDQGKVKNKELLQVPEAVEEIKRHLWIESEKAGYDIGFDRAAEDWLNKYSDSWIKYHRTAKKSPKKSSSKNKTSSKRRRAKSYFF